MTSSVATMMPPRTRCLVTVRTYAERERFLQRRQQLEQQHAAQVSAGLALSAARERGLRVERDRQDSQEAEREVTRLVRRNGPRHPPPPPPPTQVGRVAVVAAWKKVESKADGEVPGQDVPAAPAMPAVVPVATTASAPPSAQAGAPTAAGQPALSTFTTVTLSSGRTSPKAHAGPRVLAKPPLPSAAVNGAVNGAVKSASNGPAIVNGGQNPPNHMIAIQQSRLKPVHHHVLHQQQQQPPPPPPQQQQQLRVTHRAPAPARPSVCVTIREYGGAGSRQPSKLTFLSGQQQQQQQDDASASGLQGELAATLSRSNLRTRTDLVDGVEAVAKDAASESSKPLDDVARGSVTVTSVNGSRATEAQPAKSSAVPNGILKKASVTQTQTQTQTHMGPFGPVGHGLTPAMLAGAGAALKPKSAGVATKTISFGAKATIINEKPVST